MSRYPEWTMTVSAEAMGIRPEAVDLAARIVGSMDPLYYVVADVPDGPSATREAVVFLARDDARRRTWENAVAILTCATGGRGVPLVLACRMFYEDHEANAAAHELAVAR